MEPKKERKYVKNRYGHFDLAFELKNIMKWLETKPKYSALSEKLRLIKYMGIPLGIMAIVFFLTAIFSLTLTNFTLSMVVGIIALGSIIALIIVIKITNKLIRSVFTEYCLETPEIELIEDGSWIYFKKYRSILGFTVAFTIYTIITGTVLFVVISYFFLSLSMGLLFIPFSALFGLIFGAIFGTLWSHRKSAMPLYFLSVTLSPFLFYPIFFTQFDPIRLLLLISLVLILVGCYFVNKLIYRILESNIFRRIADDLSNYFESHNSIHVPTWKWMASENHFPLLFKAIDRYSLHFTIENDYLKKL